MKHPLEPEVEYILPVSDSMVWDRENETFEIYMEREMVCLRAGGYAFRPTLDDWFPNFPGNLVGINIRPRYKRFRAGKFAASEWVLDHWALIIQGHDAWNSSWSFRAPTQDEIRRKYLSLPVVITKSDLLSRGFKHD